MTGEKASPKWRRWIIPVTVLCIFLLAGLSLFLWLRPSPTPLQKFRRSLKHSGAERPHIILFTLDTTRADHLPGYGYELTETPNLDELDRRGILFEQCVSASPYTLPSHCSIMTGLYPTFHGVRINGNTALGDTHLTLAEALKQNQYQCAAFIAAFVLDGRWGLKQGFDHYDDYFDLNKYKRLDLGSVQRRGDEIVDAALAWMESRTGQPFFAWIHLYDPHVPYDPPEPYFSRHSARGMIGLYDGEIEYMDEQIGRVSHWLAEKGMDRNTVMVLVGDHGEGLGDHGEMTHGYYVYDYAVHVPLIIVPPANSPGIGQRVGSQVRTIDLYSTILEMAGVDPTPQNQGRSLLPLIIEPQTEDSRPAYSESLAPNIQFGWSPLYSLRTFPLKFIDAPRPELYDLSSDAGELDNIKLKRSREMKQLQERLTQLIEETSRGAPPPESADLDRDTLNRLASLGYLGTPNSVQTPSRRGEPLADPKDKLEIYEAVMKASEAISNERIDEAIPVLEEVLTKDTNVTQAKLYLSTCYMKKGRMEEAKAQLDEILTKTPDHIQALISLANLLNQQEKDEDVVVICRKALSVDPRSTQALILMGNVFLKRNDYQTALPSFRKAVEIQPKMTQSRQSLAACLIGLKQYEEAEKILTEILAEQPKFPMSNYHLGLLQEEQNRWEEAKKSYQREVEYYPQAYKARFNLANILLSHFNDLDGYLEHMESFIQLAPKLPQGYLFLARGLLRASGETERIEQLVNKGLSLAGSNARWRKLAYYLLADVYSRMDQPEKVRAALRQAEKYNE